MSNENNVLLIGCGDKRLGAKLLEAISKKLQKKTYNLLIPGPDACVSEDEDHMNATSFFVARFQKLTGATLRIFLVHEDCAGCVCSPDQHAQNAINMALVVNERTAYADETMVIIARKPNGDEYASWELEELAFGTSNLVAAE